MSFEALMETLRAEYLAELPAKISIIETHCFPEHLTHLREDFHKLKGTGRTYGIGEISVLAEVIEQMVIHHPDRVLNHKEHFISLLKDIHRSRLDQKEFPLETDARYLALL